MRGEDRQGERKVDRLLPSENVTKLLWLGGRGMHSVIHSVLVVEPDCHFFPSLFLPPTLKLKLGSSFSTVHIEHIVIRCSKQTRFFFFLPFYLVPRESGPPNDGTERRCFPSLIACPFLLNFTSTFFLFFCCCCCWCWLDGPSFLMMNSRCNIGCKLASIVDWLACQLD